MIYPIRSEYAAGTESIIAWVTESMTTATNRRVATLRRTADAAPTLRQRCWASSIGEQVFNALACIQRFEGRSMDVQGFFVYRLGRHPDPGMQSAVALAGADAYVCAAAACLALSPSKVSELSLDVHHCGTVFARIFGVYGAVEPESYYIRCPLYSAGFITTEVWGLDTEAIEGLFGEWLVLLWRLTSAWFRRMDDVHFLPLERKSLWNLYDACVFDVHSIKSCPPNVVSR